MRATTLWKKLSGYIELLLKVSIIKYFDEWMAWRFFCPFQQYFTHDTKIKGSLFRLQWESNWDPAIVGSTNHSPMQSHLQLKVPPLQSKRDFYQLVTIDMF